MEHMSKTMTQPELQFRQKAQNQEIWKQSNYHCSNGDTLLNFRKSEVRKIFPGND